MSLLKQKSKVSTAVRKRQKYEVAAVMKRANTQPREEAKQPASQQAKPDMSNVTDRKNKSVTQTKKIEPTIVEKYDQPMDKK